MYEEIKNLLQQIKHHQHQHKVTIFNKQKNYENMKAHNIAQGKLIENLKTFPYFNSLNQDLACIFIQPDFLRKDRVLVNANQKNQLTQYLLCEGVVAIHEVRMNEQIEAQDTRKKSLKFHTYLSNGSLISFSQFPQNLYQIISHSDCKMLKLPSKQELDPIIYQKKIIQTNQLFSHNPDYAKCKSLFIKCIEKTSRSKQQSVDPTFCLSPFDFNELFMKAKIESYDSLTRIYQTNQTIDRIGLILKGRVVQENVKLRNRKIVRFDNAILKLYKTNFSQNPNKVEKNQNLLQQADWIGLEDYLKHLQTKPFRLQKITKDPAESQTSQLLQERSCPRQLNFFSSKQIRSKQSSSVLWIPVDYFARKFNYQTNYSIVDQWRTLIDIKHQAKTKNDKIYEQIQTQRTQRENLSNTGSQILPKLPGRLQQMSHNINELSAKTQIKTKMIYDKQLKFGKSWLRNVKISDTSLLGITMRRESDLQLSKIYEQGPELKQTKKFSQFSKSTKNKMLQMPKTKRNLETLRSKMSKSQTRIDNSISFAIDTSPEDLIMYPQAYETDRLSPDLKSQLFQAQKALRLEELQYNLPRKQPTMALELSRAHSMEREITNQNRLTSIGSKASLLCATVPSSPEEIYKGLAEKISFKFPNLDEKLRIEKLYKSRNKKFEKLTVKERIQTLRILQELERKNRIKKRNSLLQQNPNSTQIRRKNGITHRQNLSQHKLSLYM